MHVRRRYWVEVVCSAVAALLGVLTAIVPDWIEEVFHVDPDAGSGALEWGIVLALLAVAITLGQSARREHARAQRQRAA
jgi:hypothetical protein